MPSPQSLVAFLLSLFVLLLVTRVQLGLGPGPAAATSIVLSVGVGWVVERFIPPDVDDEEECDVSVDPKPEADG